MVLNFLDQLNQVDQFYRLSSECGVTESITNSALWCIECFIWPSSHFLGLLLSRTVRCRNIDTGQCKLLSHRHLLKMFHFFYLECTSVRNSHWCINFFYYITLFIQNNIISIGPFSVLWATLNHDFHFCRFI